MNRPRIKIDLGNYLGLEANVNFRAYQEKTFNVISSLNNSRSNPQAMTGWLNLPGDSNMFSALGNFAAKVKTEEKYDHLLVIGIGGSSLGAQALIEAINSPLWNRLAKGKRKGFLGIDFIDNLDPQIIRNVLSRLKLNETLFVVVSKGGSTPETIVPMLIAKEWTGENFYKQCVFVTSENKGLLFDLAKKNAIQTFSIPENVGGRYSVFSPVGLLPAVLCGLDLKEIHLGIQEADRICQEQDLKANIAATIALCAYFSHLNGKNIFALMPYSTCMKRFCDWFVQLWAESLGKSNKGSTPLPAIGATDQHSQLQMFNEGPNDKLISFIRISKHKRDLIVPDFSGEHSDFRPYSRHKVGEILNMELDATRRVLTEHGRSNILITLPELDEYYLSQLMYVFHMATAITGGLLGVNPFDQPGVELAKKYTKEALIG